LHKALFVGSHFKAAFKMTITMIKQTTKLTVLIFLFSILYSCKDNKSQTSKQSFPKITIETITGIFFSSPSQKMDTLRKLGFKPTMSSPVSFELFWRQDTLIEGFVLYNNGSLEYQTESPDDLRQLLLSGVKKGLILEEDTGENSTTERIGIIPQRSTDGKASITIVDTALKSETFNSPNFTKPNDYKNITLFTGGYKSRLENGITIYYIEVAKKSDTTKTK
jgi:hypothetical protein